MQIGTTRENRTYGAMTNIKHGMQGRKYNVKFACKGMSMTKHSQAQTILAHSEYKKQQLMCSKFSITSWEIIYFR